MGGSGTVSNQFRAKWGTDTRFDRIDGYIGSRVAAIDARFSETLRFVEPSPDNRATFSYEFSSILRDSGSVFDSTMRELLKVAKYASPRPEYDIRDYREFLIQNVDRQAFQSSTQGGIETIVLVMNSPWAGRHLMPFKGWEKGGASLQWWSAYNDVKHSDIEKVALGNLVNSVNALGAVAILNALIGTTGGWTRTFGQPMFFEPMDEVIARLF